MLAFSQLGKVSYLLALLPAFAHSQSHTDPFLIQNSTRVLNITALDGINGSSVLPRWQLPDFAVSNVPGLVGSLSLNLSNTSNATYSVIGAQTNAGIAHITLPNSTDDAWVMGGKYWLIFATDTPDKSKLGHGTDYVADEVTVALAVPLALGVKLRHPVLHPGACRWEDMVGL